MSAKSIVDVAKPGDEDGIVSLLRLMHEENPLAPLDEGEVRSTMEPMITRAGGICGVIRGEVIEASIGLVIGKWWFSQSTFWTDRWVFVHPAHRKSQHFDRLVAFAKRFGTLERPLHLGVTSGTRTEAKVRAYERRMTYVGAIFAWPAEAVPSPMKIEKVHKRPNGSLRVPQALAAE